MDELRRKLEKFKGTKPRIGSQHMHELMREISVEFYAIRTLDLTVERMRNIGVLAMVMELVKAYEREDYDALARSPELYGILAEGFSSAAKSN